MSNEQITLTLNIDDEGKLVSIFLPRWSDSTSDRSWQYIPCGGEIRTEQTFQGYTVPAQIEVGYWFGTNKYWTFFQAEIDRADFN